MSGKVETTNLQAPVGEWTFARASADPQLEGRVREFWEVQGTLLPFRETLLPNGCVELMVNLGPPHQLISEQGPGTWTGAWFSGLHERALIIESLEGTHLVSARMDPLGAAELLGEAVAGAANTVVDLEQFLGPEGPSLVDRVRAAGNTAERFGVLEDFLKSRSAAPCPPFIRSTAERIAERHGMVRIAELQAEQNVSRKHLAVTFQRFLGVSPKAYAKLQRFVWTLERLRESTAVEWSKLALEAGYSDQSHLVRDFQRIGAASPTEYLRKLSPDGTALLAEPG